jgi:hypothetical protein
MPLQFFFRSLDAKNLPASAIPRLVLCLYKAGWDFGIHRQLGVEQSLIADIEKRAGTAASRQLANSPSNDR